jgi:ribosomal protein S18 acetylase RimI-like enzyme
MTVEPSLPGDRAPILAVAAELGVFDAEEVDVVAELFDGYLHDPIVSGYNFLTDRDPQTGAVLGFACWGPTSLSRGATDLYWIATARDAQQRGVGGRLFQAVEAAVRAAGRWLIVIWTSSRPDYEPARRFYQRMGCELASQIGDFYDHGDDLVVYVKRL